MVSDSIFSASITQASKDLGKKKKANRSAKLKQCKLGARREQWLSQVRNKALKDEVNGINGGEINNSSGGELEDKSANHLKDGLGMRGKGGEVNYDLLHQEIDSESSANSPISTVSSCGNDPGNSYNGCDSSSHSGSSFVSGVGSFSEEGEGGDDDDHHDDDTDNDHDNDNDEGCFDDWEAVADALAANDRPAEDSSLDSVTEKDYVVQLDAHCEPSVTVDKPDLETVEQGFRPAINTRAWRVDDAFRPQSLPSLMKQKSFPMNLEKHWGHGINPWGYSHAPPVPTSCPICYEDLDMTDSSFVPCLCGFRLCLFCHKRILEGDGRCPGCRKSYELDDDPRQASVSEGSATVRLARSCSMFSRA